MALAAASARHVYQASGERIRAGAGGHGVWGSFATRVGGHRTVGHDGICRGLSLGHGARSGRRASVSWRWPTPDGSTLAAHRCPSRMRCSVTVLDLQDDAVRTDVPDHPEVWSDLRGWHSLGPGAAHRPPAKDDARGRRRDRRPPRATSRFVGRPRSRRCARAFASTPRPDDPYAFRIDLSGLELGASPVVFGREPDGEVTALHLGLTPMSLRKRPDVQNPSPWPNGALAADLVAKNPAPCPVSGDRAGSGARTSGRASRV